MDILLQRVFFGYGASPVLEDVSMVFPQGSRTAIMGRSGSGKTTLLHLLAGLLRPDSGSIVGLPREGTAMVFQKNRLLPWHTVLQNLQAAVPHAPSHALCALLEELGLAGWENAYPRALSGGMARRVAIARALLFESPLLLLDEPFSGLDETTRDQVAAVVQRCAAGRTVVAVVHDREDATLLDAVIHGI